MTATARAEETANEPSSTTGSFTGMPASHRTTGNAIARITGWCSRKNGIAAAATTWGGGRPNHRTRIPRLRALTTHPQACTVNSATIHAYVHE